MQWKNLLDVGHDQWSKLGTNIGYQQDKRSTKSRASIQGEIEITEDNNKQNGEGKGQ